MPRTKKNYAEQKRKITKEIEVLFIEKGYDHTSLDDILKALNLSKGRFYHYFTSKEEVILESMHILSEKLLLYADEILKDNQLNAIEKLLKFIPFRENAFKDKNEILKSFQMIYETDVQKYHFLKILGKEYVMPFSTLIQEGVEEGLFEVAFPYETADLLMSAILSVPNLFLEKGTLEYQLEREKYDKAVEDLVIRTLNVKIQR